MIAFRRRTMFESIKRMLSPAYRRKCDAELREAIRFLVANPSEPCGVEGHYVPDGYGDFANQLWGDSARTWDIQQDHNYALHLLSHK